MWSINQHFRSEAKLLLLLVATPVVVAIAVWLAVSVRNWLVVDKCLDAGGRYDYEQQVCVYAATSDEGDR